MFTNSRIAKSLQSLGVLTPEPKLDSAAAAAATALAKKTLDDASTEAAAEYALADVRVHTIAALHQWAETLAEDLEEGETMADRLTAMLIGVANEDQDGAIDDDVAALAQLAANAAFDYLVAKGATEADAAALLNDDDAGAADRVQELLRNALPDGDEAASEDIDAFVFDPESQESVLDSTRHVLDSVFSKRRVTKSGGSSAITKRVTGEVHLSGPQRVSIHQARKRVKAGHLARVKHHMG